MLILSQTLKGHNSETVRPFELKVLSWMYFDQLYLRSTREVLEIDQSISIDMLSMPGVGVFTTNSHLSYSTYYRVFQVERQITKLYSWAQRGRREEGGVLPVFVLIFCVKISVF
jgi:hypothetical protein